MKRHADYIESGGEAVAEEQRVAHEGVLCVGTA